MASRCFTLLLGPLAVALAVAAGAPLLAQTTSKIAAHLVLLDGSPLPYQSLAISDEKLSGASVPANLKLDDLRRIELGGDISPASAHSPFIVELRSSGKIFATRIAIEN